MHCLRLTHPCLDFYVDLTLHERDGRYMATADLAEDSPDAGVGDTLLEAARDALRSLGEPHVSEMAEGVSAGSESGSSISADAAPTSPPKPR